MSDSGHSSDGDIDEGLLEEMREAEEREARELESINLSMKAAIDQDAPFESSSPSPNSPFQSPRVSPYKRHHQSPRLEAYDKQEQDEAEEDEEEDEPGRHSTSTGSKAAVSEDYSQSEPRGDDENVFYDHGDFGGGGVDDEPAEIHPDASKVLQIGKPSSKIPRLPRFDLSAMSLPSEIPPSRHQQSQYQYLKLLARSPVPAPRSLPISAQSTSTTSLRPSDSAKRSSSLSDPPLPDSVSSSSRSSRPSSKRRPPPRRSKKSFNRARGPGGVFVSTSSHGPGPSAAKPSVQRTVEKFVNEAKRFGAEGPTRGDRADRGRSE